MKLIPEGLIPHVKVRTGEELRRRQFFERLDDFFFDLHPDSPMAKILCECWDKQDCTDFGFYLMKYLDEYEAEKLKEED
ncbi:MAG: hypothetical protein NUV74_05425 [Candidatus Brocadiaceae bacterium]|nr:hypothetical protein [Candidatus Brocadiaceae bacterium]